LKEIFVKDLSSGKRIQGVFFVKNKVMAIDRQGKPYLIVLLSDKTGDVEARLWENVEHFSKLFEVNDVVMIDGWTQTYQGKLQIKLIKIMRSEEEWNFEDFFPGRRREKKELIREFNALFNMYLRDVYLIELVDLFLKDQDFMEKFLTVPAAKSLHHAYIGGLAEHTLSVMKAVVKLSEHYRRFYGESFNHEVALVGAFLHDVGKIKELSYEKSFNYTDEGRLLGHIIQGIQMVDEKIKSIKGFPELLRLHILHIIASHHGNYEFGSPKRPKTIEALIVHYADDLDSKIESFHSHMKEIRDTSDDRWTGYLKHYDRFLFVEPYESSELEPSESTQLEFFSDFDE